MKQLKKKKKMLFEGRGRFHPRMRGSKWVPPALEGEQVGPRCPWGDAYPTDRGGMCSWWGQREGGASLPAGLLGGPRYRLYFANDKRDGTAQGMKTLSIVQSGIGAGPTILSMSNPEGPTCKDIPEMPKMNNKGSKPYF